MKKYGEFMQRYKIYSILSIILTIIFVVGVTLIGVNDNVLLSMFIQVIMIFYLCKLIYGGVLYIREKYKEQKYSYNIVFYLCLIMFYFINVLRQLDLLIFNFGKNNIIDIYTNTLNSFSFFAMILLPFIFIISIYSLIANVVLIKREGFNYRNALGILLVVMSLAGVFGSQAIYMFTKTLNLSENGLFIKKFIDVSLNAVLSYFYCLIISTLYCNIRAASHEPSYDKDYLIILGCKVRKDGRLTPLLKSRVDRAISFYKNQLEKTKKKLVFIPSGGKGSDEVISEAEAMRNYLVEQGISKKDILIEDKSCSTYENMLFSNKIINSKKSDSKIAFSTTNYHVFRSGVIAYNEGIECEGIGSKTKWYFYTNALIREFIANIVQDWKKHAILLLIINISLFILIMIGRYYQFIFIK